MKCIVLLFLGSIIAQLCVAQDMGFRGYEPPANPATDYYKQQITEQVQKQLNKIDWSHVERSTSGGTTLYTIPVVVHVLHNYGTELAADTNIYKMINLVNSYFLKTNPDTVNIIDKFKPVASSTQIAFKLATIDPYGNQTKGVEHIFTYLTYNADDQSKLNQWPQDRYLNIWTVNATSAGTVATYYTPYSAAYQPYYDGIIFNSGYLVYGSWPSRYFAKYLNLPYPCNGYSGACVDNDGIPDTPPCNASYTCSNIYDTTCDTPNTQNVMSNYDTCGIMFTYGQGQYMQYILQLDFGNRDSLITPYTFSSTGMDQPMPDMVPVADFSVGANFSPYGVTPPVRFYCESQNVVFKNESWNDTVIAAAWTFSNNANIPSSSLLTTVANKFHQPGWVTVTLAATGNNTNTDMLIDGQALFIADSVPTVALGYEQEFNAGSGMDKWPMFNYYRNEFQWQLANVGYADNTSLEYVSYDSRTFPQNTTGTPQGDVDDIFTPAFDLIGFTDSCFLNFMSSGATYTAETKYMKDSFEIDYSINHAQSWQVLKGFSKGQLDNKGTVATPYTPSSMGDWVAHTISLPAVARTAYTLFRFRYYPGADSTGVSSGNNFYLDNFNFNGFPESIQNIEHYGAGVTLLPNPTQGNAYIIVKDNNAIQTVLIMVTDITGKIVYKTTRTTYSNTARIEIPEDAIKSKGVYLVHVVTNGINQTEKLVVY